MSHVLFMAFNKHYRPLQNGTQEFRSIYRATSVNWKNLTSVMYVRFPNKLKPFFRILSNTCLPVRYYDVTSRYGSEEVMGWTTAEYLIPGWGKEFLLGACQWRFWGYQPPTERMSGTKRSGCTANHSVPFTPSYFLFKGPFRN